MARNKFSDDCPGCRPAMVDVQTGRVLGPEDPVMQKMMAIWNSTTRAQRKAYHRVMCQNSRNPSDLEIVKGIVKQLQEGGRN